MRQHAEIVRGVFADAFAHAVHLLRGGTWRVQLCIVRQPETDLADAALLGRGGQRGHKRQHIGIAPVQGSKHQPPLMDKESIGEQVVRRGAVQHYGCSLCQDWVGAWKR